MCDIRNWLLNPIKWTTNHVRLLQSDKQNIKLVTVSNIIENSDNFPVKPNVTSTTCKSLLETVAEDVIDRNIQSVYPVMHEAVLFLCAEFLLFKLKHGSTIEKELYKNMTLLEFIQRLLEKRAVCFVRPLDSYLLRDGTVGHNDHWKYIGTCEEKKPLILQDYLSCDELKLSAFLSVSSYSYFVNNGRRDNAGELDPRDTLQEEGVIVGLIGPRMHKEDVMEYQEIITARKPIKRTFLDWCNFKKGPETVELFFKFYQEKRKSYYEIKMDTSQRYVKMKDDVMFDKAVYRKRLAVSFDTLLIEANARAKAATKAAYVHVVGLGIGVWRVINHQLAVYHNTFLERIKALGQNLSRIATIHFSYVYNIKEEGSLIKDGNNTIFPVEDHPLGGIKLYFCTRQPFSKVGENHRGELLVVSYAWDSNAFPGNEFWAGSSGDSSDSATAASSQVSELHNPYINPLVTGQNLRVATPAGIVPATEYLRNALANLHEK